MLHQFVVRFQAGTCGPRNPSHLLSSPPTGPLPPLPPGAGGGGKE